MEKLDKKYKIIISLPIRWNFSCIHRIVMIGNLTSPCFDVVYRFDVILYQVRRLSIHEQVIWTKNI